MKHRLALPLFLMALAFLFTLARGQAVGQSPDKSNSPFGVIEATENPAAADELGAVWTRLTFHWAEIQAAGPDSWEDEFSEEQIQREIESGRLIVGLLIGIPDWARDGDGLPRGLWLDRQDPDNLWAAFVGQIVSRYAGRIDHWVIWNEPDIPAGELAHTWEGTVADFAQLQKAAYLAAKEANRQTTIHLAAFTYWADYYAGKEQYMARLLDELAADDGAQEHHSYFDVASAHLYFQPTQIFDLLTLFVDIMRHRELDQPIWLVETNAPPRDDPAWPVPNWTLSVTLDEQAAFMPQAMASALAAGAERVAVYKLQDTDEDRAANPEPFGLIRQDGRRRPSWRTLREAMERLSDAFHVERERWNEVGQIRLDQEGQTTTVLFARLPYTQQARVPASAQRAILVNMWGEEREMAAVDGAFQVDLPPALCTQPIGDYCMIGGTTYYLIQEAEISRPTPTSTATATATASPSPTLSPTASPTPAPSVTPTPIPTTEATATLMPTTEVSLTASLERTGPAEEGVPGTEWPLLGLLAGGLVVGLASLWRRMAKRGG